jgi:glycosyltransferase involved in cell wall biosynthesis
VLTYTIKPNIWGALAARLCGVPSVSMVTGLGYAFTEADKSSVKRLVVHAIATRLYRLGSSCNRQVIFQNPDDPLDFVATGCLRDVAKVRIINGSGVDLDHYSPTPLPNSPVFIMVSRLLKNKGVREYCLAAIACKRTHPEARFLLVGFFDDGVDGIARSDLDDSIASGLEYLGPQADVRAFLAQSSIYVLPSYREGTPRSVLEAMAMGRTIITTDAPGCRETTVDGETGYLVPIFDVIALTKAMVQMIENPEMRAEMGRASLERARLKYDVHKVNADIIKVLDLD